MANQAVQGALWIVTDQLPYPPRNGITLPIYRYACGLAAAHPIQLLVFEDVANPLDRAAVAENEKQFGPIRIIRIVRADRTKRILNELTGKDMYQHGWDAAEPLRLDGLPPCDALLVSPISAVAKAESSGMRSLVEPLVSIAAVSDCTTAEYFYRSQQHFGSKVSAAKARSDRLRCRFVAPIEARLLSRYDHVLVQTETDRNLMAKLVSAALAAKVTVAPNGVDESYFKLRTQRTKQVMFVAELSGEYESIARWLVAEVWPRVAARHPDSELLVVGRGAKPALKELLAQSPRVRHVEFVERLERLYERADVALSPVFKGFGLINKTLEAMAAGLPVVGGLPAFNGIPGFVSGVHGVVCATRRTEDFVQALDGLLADPRKRSEVGTAARNLLAGRFRWDATIGRLGSLLQPSTRSDREYGHGPLRSAS